MNPGVYSDITNNNYHNGAGISNSGLSLLRKSPLHYRMKQLAANDNEPKKEPSAALMIGTAFHALLLEPECFTRDYCLALRPQDVPDAIVDRDAIVSLAEEQNEYYNALLAEHVQGVDELRIMINGANACRLAMLPSSGSKQELIKRIQDACSWQRKESPQGLDACGVSELKIMIGTLNKERDGLLSGNGTEAELCARLRDAGEVFTTRKEAIAKWEVEYGFPMLIDSKASMADIATSLRQHGVEVSLFSEVKQTWLQNNGHRIVLEPEQWDQLHRMRAAVFAHPVASKLMSMKGRAEHSVYWVDKETGELCRCRPDWWPSNLIVDLKTTEDASPIGFAKSIANYSYDVQDAFYTDGMAAAGEPIRAFLFLAVQKDACVVEGQSFGVAVYQLDDASRELGRAKYKTDLRTFSQCKKLNQWPNYGDMIQPISLPQWNFNQFQHLVEATA